MNDNLIFNDNFPAMGTRCEVVFPGMEPGFGEQIFGIIKNELVHLEQKLSSFIPDSPVSELNRAPKNKWITLDDEIWDAISICYDFYQMSNGAFDITMAQLIKLWKDTDNPSSRQLERARSQCGFDKVEFDPENKKIRFLVDYIEFDLGAFGKGYALDRLKPILEKQGVKNGIVSFGESSILALGSHPNGAYWPLGIRNQVSADEYVHIFKTKNETITTSGTIFTSDDGVLGKRKHIISPETGKPVLVDKTVSVKSESAVIGEFISTTWLILSENDQSILSENFKNIEILEAGYLNEKDIQTKLTILTN